MNYKANHHSFYFAISVATYILLLVSVAQAAGTLAIQSLSPGVSVPAGVPFSLSVVASGFTNPNFLLEDNFGGTTLSSANINSSGYLSWTPTANNIGTHSLTITASDSLGSASIAQTITVTSPVMTLSPVSPNVVVNVGTPVSFSSTVAGFSSPTYGASDSFAGSVTNTNINSSGYFSWIPTIDDVGVHAVTVTATDAAGHSTSATQSITVNPAASIGVASLLPGATLPPGQQLTFALVTTGLTSPVFTIHDSFVPTTIGNSNLDASGNFSWLPSTDEIGVHSLSFTATDGVSGHVLPFTQVITVQPLSVNIQGLTQSSVSPGSPTYFSIIAGGFSSTTYSVSDSFVGSTVTNTNINSSGYFSWIPVASDIGTHVLTLTASNPSGHVASTSQQIIVRTVSSSILPVEQSGTPSTVSATTSSSVIALLLLQIQTLQAQLVALRSGQSVSSVTVYKFLTPLTLGSSGTAVTELQKRLKKEGLYTGPINGKFGPLTKATVMKYQAKHGLAQVGNVGPGTRAALNAE